MWLMLVTFAASILAADDSAARAYLDQVESRIMAVWKLPEKVEGRRVIVRMQLESSGRVSNVRVEKSSGDKTFDASAVTAVRTASPFPAVPESAKIVVGDLHMVLDPIIPNSRVEKMREKTDSKNNPSSRR
jgi:TonB family protein